MCTAHIIGKRIKEYRKKSKLSQLSLAVEIGYDQGDLCKVENGKSIPTIPVLIRFADFFGLKLWAFLKEIDV